MKKVQAISVTFTSDQYDSYRKQYTFLTDLEVKTGDLVACETSRGMAIGRVAALGDIISITDKTHYKTKWAFQKIDIDACTALNEHRNKVSDILKRLKDIRSSHDETAIYRQMAETNPAVADLLRQLDEITDANNISQRSDGTQSMD